MRRYSSGDVRKHAEGVNTVAGIEIVHVSSWSPGGNSRVRFELQWLGVTTQIVLGARAACDTLDAARYAIECMKVAREKAAVDPLRAALSQSRNG